MIKHYFMVEQEDHRKTTAKRVLKISLRIADIFHRKGGCVDWRSLKDRRVILDDIQLACRISLLIKDTSQVPENWVSKAIGQAFPFPTNPNSGQSRGWKIIIY